MPLRVSQFGDPRATNHISTADSGETNFSIKAFTNDAVSRGKIDPNWYLTSVQAGFEPWIGGAGLAVNQFAFNVNGGGGGGSAAVDTAAPRLGALS